MKKIKFWEEDVNVQSATRLVFIIGAFYAMGMGYLVWIATLDYVATLALFSGIFSLVGALKLVQKPMEGGSKESALDIEQPIKPVTP